MASNQTNEAGLSVQSISDRPCCRFCKRKLRKASPAMQARYGGTYGRFADDLFCKQSCAYTWAIQYIRAAGPVLERLGMKL